MLIVAACFLIDWCVLVYTDRGLKKIHKKLRRDQKRNLEIEEDFENVSQELTEKLKLSPETEIA